MEPPTNRTPPGRGPVTSAHGAWDTYWRGTQEAAAFGLGGISQETLTGFWRNLFTEKAPASSHPRLLDLACGHGAVVRHAYAAALASSGPEPSTFCLDYSAAAVSELRRAVPGVLGVAADAGRVPFADRRFDVVASQFGIEYAGRDAFAEALRLVAPAGYFAAIVHLKDGAIYRECERNLAAARQILDSGLMALAGEAFRAGLALRDGRGSEADFHAASAALVPAVKLLPDLLKRHGEGLAGGSVLKLYRDIEHMYRRMGAYDAADVEAWIARTAQEFEAYSVRMASMLRAALDTEEFGRLAARAEVCGLRVETRETLSGTAKAEPMCWALVCRLG